MNTSNLVPFQLTRFLRNSSRSACAFGGVALATCLLTSHAAAQTVYTWGNTGTDWNTAGNWTPNTGFPGSVPATTTDTALFAGPEATNPNLSGSVSITGVNFSTADASGYNLTASTGATLTLNSVVTTPTSGTIALNAANTTGSNTISAPLVFGATTNVQVIEQQGIGGTLFLAGTLKTNGSTLQIGNTGTGVVIVQGNNGTVGAPGTLTSPVKFNGGTLVLGTNGTLGSNSFQFNTSSNLASSDATSRTIPNTLLAFGGGNPIYVLGRDPNSSVAANTNIGNGDLIFTNTTAIALQSAALGARKFVVYNNTTFAAALTGTSTNPGGLLKTGSGTLTLNGNNTFSGTVTVQGSYSYTSPNAGTVVSAASGGTLVLGGSNTFTGTTAISAGTLSAAADNALQNTASISVDTGGMLRLANATTNNNRVNNAAPITLGTGGATPTGGTIQKGTGVSEGTSTAIGLGALTLATGSTGSAIDYTATAGTLTFASFTPNGATLTISNYLNDGTEHLIFNQDVSGAGYLGNITFAGYGGDTQTALGGGFFEITPTAVPEPATWVWGLASVGLLGFRFRGRARRLFRLA